MNCKNSKAAFVDALYGELTAEQREAFEGHLDSCPACAHAFAALQATSATMHRRERQAPDPAFMDSLWAHIAPELEKAGRRRQRFYTGLAKKLRALPRPRRLTAGLAGTVAIFLLGLFIGRRIYGPLPESQPALLARKSPVTASDIEARQKSLRYLERSKILLLGLVNAEAADAGSPTLGVQRNRQLSRALVQEADALKNELARSPYLRLRELIADIEMVMVQIANLEESQDLPAIELIKDTVDNRGILLKINLEKMKQDSEISRSFRKKNKKSQKSL